MKRFISIILIFALLLLSGCNLFDGNPDNTDGAGDNINNGGITDGDNGDGSSDNNDGEIPGSDNGGDDSSDESGDEVSDGDKTEPDQGGSNDGETPENPMPERETLADYIENLIDSEYCNDGDFLRMATKPVDTSDRSIIYVSNNGDGDGSITDPMSLEEALDGAKPGDTVYLRGGEYIFKETIWLSLNGTKDDYIVIKSYPGEKAVLTTTPENVDKYDENGEYIFFGFDEGCSYLLFEDLEIFGATDEYTAAFACFDGGQHHLIFRNIEIHDLKTTYTEGGSNAFLFLGEKKESINNIILLNNRCYNLTLGYSEAISFAGNCEYCYVIGNEVYDNTNIGIDFYGNAGYCSVEALDQARYCVAAYNKVYNCNSPYADCAGIYVDGGRNCLIEGNLVYGSQYGIEIGSEELNESYPVTDITVRNNVLQGNTVCAMRIGGYDKKSSGTVKNCFVYNNTIIDNLGDYDIIISKADGIVFANNVFVSKDGYIETEFSSSYINNLQFYNNCFGGASDTLEIYGEEIDIETLNNRYGSDNFACEISVGEDFAPNVSLSGCADYSSRYDFYLVVREKNQIGAVEAEIGEK